MAAQAPKSQVSARRPALALALVLAVHGCDPDPGEGSSGLDGGTWPMELGQGELAFAPLEEGDTLPYVAGAQGGYHVFVAFRMRDLDPMRVLVRVTTAVEGDDELMLDRRGRVTFEVEANPSGAVEPADAGTGPSTSYVYAGWPAQILEAGEHSGERTRIDVQLEDRNGRRASAGQTIVIGTGVSGR
jgi:hypothetical protein